MSIGSDSEAFAAVPSGVDGAVGVPSPKWFVALVSPRHEKSVSEKLQGLGIESYVATQSELHQWKNGRRRQIERVVIPGVVFVRSTEKERREIVYLPYINRFLSDKASVSDRGSRVAVVPDVQMERLRFMLGHSDETVGFESRRYSPGERVRVVRGGLCGLEGEAVESLDGKCRLLVRLDILGCAIVEIGLCDIEPAQ